MGPFGFAFSYVIFPGILFATVVGLLFEGIDRKIGAHIQSRIGPPVWQPFIDMTKLFGKEDITPSMSQSWLFNFAPLLSFGSIVLVMCVIPVSSAVPVFGSTADLIVVIYLLNIPAIALMLGGFASSASFGTVGSRRYVVQLFGYELPFITSALTVCALVGSLSLATIVDFQIQNGWLLYQLPLAFIAILLSYPGKVLKVPFDIPEADSEIVMGPLVEYSGPKLAIFHISYDIEIFAVAALITALFLGGPQPFMIGGLVVPGIVSFFLKCLALLFFMIFVRTVYARLKIGQALKFYWTFVVGIALVNLIWVLVT